MERREMDSAAAQSTMVWEREGFVWRMVVISWEWEVMEKGAGWGEDMVECLLDGWMDGMGWNEGV
jgi:hypothetical protein